MSDAKLFNVRIERTYKARHFATIRVRAESADDAYEAVRASMDEDGSLDPDTYRDTQETEGYDDAGSWAPVEGEAAEVDPGAPWADADGRCLVCHEGHYHTQPCAGAADVALDATESGDAWDNTLAAAEGWLLTQNGEGWHIERDDSSDVLPNGTPFASDDDALAFVKVKAAAGSAYHAAALATSGE